MHVYNIYVHMYVCVCTYLQYTNDFTEANIVNHQSIGHVIKCMILKIPTQL